jgi:hypothetical protein
MKAKYTLAIDTERSRVIAYSDFISKQHPNIVEAFAATIHTLTFNNYIILDSCEASFANQGYTAPGVHKILKASDMKIADGTHTLGTLISCMEMACTDDASRFIPASKFKVPAKVAGFVSNLTTTTKESAMTEATAAKKVSKKAAQATKSDAPKRVEKALLSNGDRSERPAVGGKTSVVWEIADKNFRSTRSEILALCKEQGIADATAATQYGRWRRERLVEGKQVGPSATALAAIKKAADAAKEAAKAEKQAAAAEARAATKAAKVAAQAEEAAAVPS